MNYGTCELIGSALVAGLKSTFFFLGGLALLIVPPLLVTHILLPRKTIGTMSSPRFVLYALVYFIFCVSGVVIALTAYFFSVLGPLPLLFWPPVVLVGLPSLSIYLWIIRSRRYGSSETPGQRRTATALIMAIFVLACSGLLIEPSFRNMLNEYIFGAYKPSTTFWPGAFSKEECFARGGKSYGTVQGNEIIDYYPDGTSKSEPRW